MFMANAGTGIHQVEQRATSDQKLLTHLLLVIKYLSEYDNLKKNSNP
jgi:hypothetical protein